MSQHPAQAREFLHNYMVLREIGDSSRGKRFLAEEMRTGKEVWIDSYPLSENDAAIGRLKHVAEKIQKINYTQIIAFDRLIDGKEAFYVVMPPPVGTPLSRWGRTDEHTLKTIAAEIIRLMQWLQNHGFGIDRLSPEEVYFTPQTGRIQLLFTDGFSIRPSSESREHEIKIVGELLFFLITGETGKSLEQFQKRRMVRSVLSKNPIAIDHTQKGRL